MDGYGRDVADAVHIPDPAEELILAVDVVGILREEGEKVKFLSRKVLFCPVDKDAAGGLVDLESADLDHVVGLLSCSDQALVTGHMRLDAGHEFAGAEGLRHIVVGTESESPDLVDVIFFGGHHENRDVLFFTNLAADVKPVDPGKHEVQYDQVKILVKSCHKALVAPGLNLHLKSAQFQIILFQIRDCFFVFNDQYFAHIFTPFFLPLIFSAFLFTVSILRLYSSPLSGKDRDP